jgi:hypothetical protein
MSVAAVAGAGLLASSSTPTPPLSNATPPAAPKHEFTWPGRPLQGSKTPASTKPLELRGFPLGECALSSNALEGVVGAAADAASLSKAGYRGDVTVVGGADGTPIYSLRRACAGRGTGPGSLNGRLAKARAATLTDRFLAEFDKAGGNRSSLRWVHLPPVLTDNFNQPHDRSAILHIVWSQQLIGSR